MSIDTKKLIEALEEFSYLHKKIKKEVDRYEKDKLKILEVGGCNEKECKRKAMEDYDRCAYHRAVRERKKYRNLKDAGKLGVAGIAAGTIAKKLWDAYKSIT